MASYADKKMKPVIGLNPTPLYLWPKNWTELNFTQRSIVHWKLESLQH